MCIHWAASTLHIDHIMAFIHTTQASWRKCVNVCVFFGITTCIYFIVLCIVCMLYGIHICTIHTIRKKNTLLRFVHSGTNEKENVNRARTLTIIWTEHTLFLPVFAALIILLWLLLLTDDRPRVNFIFFFQKKKNRIFVLLFSLFSSNGCLVLSYDCLLRFRFALAWLSVLLFLITKSSSRLLCTFSPVVCCSVLLYYYYYCFFSSIPFLLCYFFLLACFWITVSFTFQCVIP